MLKSLMPVVVCMLMTFVSPIQADAGMAGSTPAQRADLQTGFMKDKLHVDDATAAKIKAINLKYAQQMDPIIKSDDNQLSKMAKARPIMAAKDAELKSALSADQYSAYEGLQDDLKAYVESKLK